MTNAAVAEIDDGRGRVVLVIGAHADDPTLFCGGTIARWSSSGWRVVVVRVTDDRWDSVGVSETDTIVQSREQFEAAMACLGVTETEHWDLPTDTLGDASEVAVRERVIRAIRTRRPHTIVCHDPHSGVGEDNEDHWTVARAVAEAIWCAQFDKHHPEHFDDGLECHGVFEQWWYGRPPAFVTDAVDVTSVMDTAIAAACCHELALRNLVRQLRLQARTGGWRVPVLDEAQTGDLRPLVESLVRARAERVGARYGLGAAEEFRVVRFGGMHDLLERFGERVDRIGE